MALKNPYKRESINLSETFYIINKVALLSIVTR